MNFNISNLNIQINKLKKRDSMDCQQSKLKKNNDNLVSKEVFNISLSVLKTFIVALVNSNGNIVKANEKFLSVFNYSLDDIETLTIDMVISESSNPGFKKTMYENIEKEKYWSGNLRLIDKFHQPVDSIVDILEFRGDGDNERNYLLIILPVNRFNEEEKWRSIAYTDDLTGLPNRRKFSECISYHIEKSNQQSSKFGLLFLDIDNFKHINDQYGHVVGDQLLKECALRLVDAVGNSAVIFRKSGDEFLIIVEEVGKVKDICDSIQHQFTANFYIDNSPISVYISLGNSVYPDCGLYEESLIHHADRVMYEQKKQNKSKREFVTPKR